MDWKRERGFVERRENSGAIDFYGPFSSRQITTISAAVDAENEFLRCRKFARYSRLAPETRKRYDPQYCVYYLLSSNSPEQKLAEEKVSLERTKERTSIKTFEITKFHESLRGMSRHRDIETSRRDRLPGRPTELSFQCLYTEQSVQLFHLTLFFSLFQLIFNLKINTSPIHRYARWKSVTTANSILNQRFSDRRRNIYKV